MLKKLITTKEPYAIYAHNQDISNIIHCIRKYSCERINVDRKSYLNIINKKRTISGFFVFIKKNKIKFYEPLKVPKVKNLFVWKGGDVCEY